MAAEDLIRVAFEKQDLDDTVSCCICTDVYTDPKALPCIHTFCMKCLQQVGLSAKKGPGDEMPCPICRRQFKIPQEGFSGLPNNFFIAKLIQMANVSNPFESSRDICDVCLEDNEETGKEMPTANMYCTDCKQKLCEECCRQHRKFKLNKNHKLISINEQQVSSDCEIAKLAASVCELHDQKVLDIYCAECKTVQCAVCFIDGHKQHEGSHVSKYVDDFRKQIESNIDTINQGYSQSEMKKAELNKIKEDMQQKVESLEEDVTKRRDELKHFADSQANSLLQSLSSLRQSKLKEIQMEGSDINVHLSCLQGYNSYCQKILAKGSASDICRAVSDLSLRALELQEQCKSLTERRIQPFNISFAKSEFEEFLEDGNLIGKIEDLKERILEIEQKREEEKKTWMKEKEELMNQIQEQRSVNGKEPQLRRFTTEDTDDRESLRPTERRVAGFEPTTSDEVLSGYKSDPVLVHTIITKVAQKKKKEIRGLTILDKELFVVNEKSSDVEVYDSIKFSFSRRWNLKELIRPEDIVSCNRNKCLYIVDYKGISKSKVIFRVHANGKLISIWSIGDFDGPFWEGSLSVTDDSNVILTLLWNGKLIEYSSDGQLIREINLSSEAGISRPWHAIKLTNGHFLVSHGYPGEDLHRVCLVDADGKLQKSFGGKSGSNIGQMDRPVHLSVDGNGFVMVTDQFNHRVLLLDSDLKFKREILSKEKHGLEYPTKIHLDESNGRLFVTNNFGLFSNDGQILILQFT